MDRYKKGIKVMREQLGEEADSYVDAIQSIAPLFAKINVECAFGDVYGDEQARLDLKTKSLCTIAALSVLSQLPQLKLHIKGARHNGVSQAEIVEVITQMVLYGGFPSATNALMTAKACFEEEADGK